MRTNVCLLIIDSNEFPTCGACDYACLAPGKLCPNVTEKQREVTNAVCESDIAYFIVPNYCGYPCGNYFAFNERSIGYFNMDRDLRNRYMSVAKRNIVVINTEGDNFANAMRQQTNNTPDTLYLKSSKYKKHSAEGDIFESEDARADLKSFLYAGCS